MTWTDFSFIRYMCWLFLATGSILLAFDVRYYELSDRKKEKKVATGLAWISFGLFAASVGMIVFTDI